jgi:DedD protein
MNQELKHRLIGAVVVTALAAIFIPMLFDDPIDDTGQMVSELAIPPAPGQSSESAENKAPSSVDQVLAKPGAESGQPGDGQDSLPDAGNIGAESVNSDGQDSEENEQVKNDRRSQSPAPDLMQAGTESYEEEEMGETTGGNENDLSKQEPKPGALDTGLIDEADQQSMTNEKLVNESEEYIPSSPAKPKNPAKSITGGDVALEKNTIRERIKPSKSSAPIAAEEIKKQAIKTKEMPKKSDQELERWYIQAGSFSRKENALTLFETLRKQQLPVVLETVQGTNGVLYRLKVGPELSRKRASDIKAKLEKQKIKSMLISE